MQDIIYEPSANDPEDKKHSLSIKLKAIYSLIKNRWSSRRILGLIALVSAIILILQPLGITLNDLSNYIKLLAMKTNQLYDNATWITWGALFALVSYLTYLLKPLGKRCIGYFRECYVEYEKLVKSFVINPTVEKPIGFVTDTPEEEKLNIGWGDYCSTIVSTLDATDLSKDCFAIGISGGWGSGKTTFLKGLQAQLKENPSYMLIEHNPWNRGNKSDIVENFFKTFSGLVGHRSSLYPHLQRYARALSDVGGVNWVALTDIFSPEKTLEELKKEINQSVLKSKKRYVFFIDDLDRLDKEEIFEVLKLIRASANFKNTIFIVAYDPDYIENMLKELGVTEPLIYLQKIFNLELSLPSFERDTIPNLLEQMLLNITKGEYKDDIIDLMSIRYQEQYLIALFIKRFRDVLRFINLFMANYTHIKKVLADHLCFQDLFWIEVLHYTSPRLYNVLKDNPERYLGLSEEYEGAQRFIAPKNRPQDLTDLEYHILQVIFPYSVILVPTNTAFLRYKDNYSKYFALRILKSNITDSSFQMCLSEKRTFTEVREQVEKWVQEGCEESLQHHMNLTEFADLNSTQEQANFLRLLAGMVIYEEHSIACEQLVRLLITGATVNPRKLHRYIYPDLEECIKTHWSTERTEHILGLLNKEFHNNEALDMMNLTINREDKDRLLATYKANPNG